MTVEQDTGRYVTLAEAEAHAHANREAALQAAAFGESPLPYLAQAQIGEIMATLIRVLGKNGTAEGINNAE